MKKLALLLLVGCAHMQSADDFHSGYSESGRLPGSMVVKSLLAQPVVVGSNAGAATTASQFIATTTSGNAFQAATGSRVDFGGGANDYAISDGDSTVTFAGALRSSGLVGAVPSNSQNLLLLNTSDATSWSMIVNSGAQSFLTVYNNSVQQTTQFANDGTVKICAGTPTGASTFASVGGALNINSTSTGNLGASGPDDLMTYSLPANSLITTGRGIKIKAWGTTANNVNSKTVRLVFGGTTLVTKQLMISVAGAWFIEAVVVRTGASAQKFFATAENSYGTTVSSADGATVLRQVGASTSAETETATIAIKGQSTASTADNDIIQQGLTVEYL